MYSPCHKFLSDAAFPMNQNGRATVGGQRDLLRNFLNGRAGSDDFALYAQLLSEVGVFVACTFQIFFHLRLFTHILKLNSQYFRHAQRKTVLHVGNPVRVGRINVKHPPASCVGENRGADDACGFDDSLAVSASQNTVAANVTRNDGVSRI